MTCPPLHLNDALKRDTHGKEKTTHYDFIRYNLRQFPSAEKVRLRRRNCHFGTLLRNSLEKN